MFFGTLHFVMDLWLWFPSWFVSPSFTPLVDSATRAWQVHQVSRFLGLGRHAVGDWWPTNPPTSEKNRENSRKMSKWHFGWWYEPCARPPAAAWCTKSPGIQNHRWRRWVPWPERPPSWDPRWAEAGAACSKANGWGQKAAGGGKLQGYTWWPGIPPKFGAKIHHFRSNPELVDRYTSFGDQDSELATGWTIAEDGTLLRVAPSSCNSPQAQCTRPPKSGGLGVSNSTGRFPQIKWWIMWIWIPSWGGLLGSIRKRCWHNCRLQEYDPAVGSREWSRSSDQGHDRWSLRYLEYGHSLKLVSVLTPGLPWPGKDSRWGYELKNGEPCRKFWGSSPTLILRLVHQPARVVVHLWWTNDWALKSIMSHIVKWNGSKWFKSASKCLSASGLVLRTGAATIARSLAWLTPNLCPMVSQCPLKITKVPKIIS